jgi:putative ABC transport system permease protein
MLKHYLATALRHFRQHKFTTGINVACLALGLTCFLAAWSVATYYGQGDQYHERADRTFVIATRDSGNDLSLNVSPWLLTEHLRTDFPQLESVARVFYPSETAITSADQNWFANVTYADPQFLRTFDLPFVHGDPRHALDKPRTAIISKELAHRMFGTADAVNRTFRLSGRDTEILIAGIVDRIPQSSHIGPGESSAIKLGFDAMLSMDLNDAARAAHRWDNNWYFTYVVLPADGSLSASTLNAQMDALVQRHASKAESGIPEFRLRPISEFITINLDSLAGTAKTGVSSTWLIKLLGALVLLVAGLNYANLATAQSVSRTKEFAMRRVVGANRAQVATQHLVEGMVLTAAALFISLLLLTGGAGLIAADFGELVNLFAALPEFWMLLAGSLLFVSCLAAVYPALVLARVRPAFALRGAKVKSGSNFMTTLLVGLQFGSASFLIIAVLVMSTQNKAMKAAVWNPSSDPVVVIANDLRAAGVNVQLFQEALRRLPNVVSVTGMHRMPWGLGGNGEPLTSSASPGTTRINAGYTIVEADVLKTINTQLLAGRTFARDRDTANIVGWNANDFTSSSDFNIVVDRLLAKQMGFVSPQAAVGQTVYHPTSVDDSTPPQRLHIVGVAEDAAIRPISLGYGSFYLMNADAAVAPVIRIGKQDIAATLSGIDAIWKTLAPEVPLKRRFADEQYELSYQFMNGLSAAFAALAAFALVIASMGLVGMALHVVQRRMHEIGVRKTLGASVTQILWMLLRSFSKPVVIANLIAWPLAYAGMSAFIQLFAHQAGLGVTPFLITLALTVGIACAAVSWQASKAARLNPANILRYE